MKKKLSKKEATEQINQFFTQKTILDPKYVKKMKRLAMAYKIRLGPYRKRFCKTCFHDLQTGETRVTKHYKTIKCSYCNTKSRWKLITE